MIPTRKLAHYAQHLFITLLVTGRQLVTATGERFAQVSGRLKEKLHKTISTEPALARSPRQRRKARFAWLTVGLLSVLLLLIGGGSAARTSAHGLLPVSSASLYERAALAFQHKWRDLGVALGLSSNTSLTTTAAACALTQTVTVSGCYYTGSSKATVSVEVGWTGAVNGDTITVSLNGGAQTRTIKPQSFYDPGSGSAVAEPIVTPQVVAFEISADNAAHTITSTLSGSSTCSIGPDSFNAPASCAPNLCTTGELGGTVYFDTNGDGIRQAGETNGAVGVMVTAYNSTNAVVATATSDNDGRYEFSPVNGNAIAGGSYPLRLEFTNLPAKGLYTTTPMGADNSSSVQFISVAQCNADVGVMNQDDYCQSNPLMMVPCYVSGDALPVGNASDADALVAFLIAVLAVLARLPV